jgi:16S rRNA U516 pseudouridylate synthase RsuA-like enzyme
MPIHSNTGGYIVSFSRRKITMRVRVKTEAEAIETLRSMQEDDIVDLNKTRYYFSKDKIMILHKPNLSCQTYQSIYGLRDKRI